MFDKEFFPTPKKVILNMISDIDLKNKVVLEPSSGKGDITSALKLKGAKVLACEKNADLHLISSQSADMIGYDFFEISSIDISHIDYIFMNPPFSDADKHILHAYRIAPKGCVIVALCNAETVLNPYSKTREELAAIIPDGGCTLLGDCFSTAERKTGVEIAMIKIQKGEKSKDEFEDYLFSDEEEPEYTQQGIIGHNIIREYVGRYIQSVQMFDDFQNHQIAINEVMKPIGGSFTVTLKATNERDTGEYRLIERDEFKKSLQKSAWRQIFRVMKMENVVTNSVMADINRFVEQNADKPFTMKNIYSMIEVIYGTREDRFKRIVLEAFDWLTMHHSGNRVGVEGWKTNESYFVGKKFIAPYCGLEYNWSGYPGIKWGERSERFDDVCKALCYLTGKNWKNDCNTLYDAFRGEEIPSDGRKKDYIYKEWGKWYDWNFFEIKVYKKGTIHVKFKDEKVWELFNTTAAKFKGWALPEDTSKKSRRKSTSVKTI